MKHNWKILIEGSKNQVYTCETCGSRIVKETKNQNLYSCETCRFQICTENEIEASKFSPPCRKNCAKCGKSFDEIPLGTFHGLVDKPTKELLCVRCC